MSFVKYLAVADLVIKAEVNYESTVDFLEEYCVSEPVSVDFSIAIDSDDLLQEKKITENIEKKASNRKLNIYTDEELEITAVLRRIIEKLPDYDAIAFHGAVVAVDDAAYMFAANSGTGKSTHTALWMELFGDKLIPVNGDKPFLRFIDGELYAYGSPWCGKEGIQTNCCKLLKAICFLEQAAENSICELTMDEVGGLLLKQCYRPSGGISMIKTMQLLDRMSKQLSFYKMKCNMDISAAEMSYDFMKDNTGK